MPNQLNPEVFWAQRSSDSDASKNYVFLTIMAADVPKDEMKLDIQPTHITFTGLSHSKKATYHVELDLYAEIEPSKSTIYHSERDVQLKLQKKDLKQEYWPRLLKDIKKVHFLKTDFDKWVDEDDQEEAADDDYMKRMEGMGGLGGDGFGDLDFSKLGGGGMGDMSGLGEAGDDSDDDMPEAEDEAGTEKVAMDRHTEENLSTISDETDTGATKSSKIEEVA